MQRYLRRLAHRADEQADADHRCDRPLMAFEDRDRLAAADGAGGVGEHGGVIHRIEPEQHAGDPQQETEVAHTVDQESLEIREDRARAFEPEADQQVRDQTHRFPAEEQLQEVVAHHQHQHREREQADVAEETLVTRIFGHVADGVDVDQQRDEGDDQHHHRGQLVDHETDVRIVAGDIEEGVEVLVERHSSLRDQLPQHVAGQRAAQADAEDGRAVRADPTDAATEQAGQDRTEQRREDDRDQDGLGERMLDNGVFHAGFRQPLSVSISATLIVRRLRNRVTRIARPIAASAAATVRMKNTKI